MKTLYMITYCGDARARREEGARVVLRLAEFGKVLGSRRLGASVRTCIERALKEHPGKITLDLSDVIMVSSSFADECFGKLERTIGRDTLRSRTTLRNASGVVAAIIADALRRREEVDA